MRYLLDTNIVIDVVLNLDEKVIGHLSETDATDVVTSSVAIAEMMHGSVRGKPPPMHLIEPFLEEVPALPFDLAAARMYAKLSFKRRSFDRLIAAQALALGLTVVTRNERDFADVPGLKVENWTV